MTAENVPKSTSPDQRGEPGRAIPSDVARPDASPRNAEYWWRFVPGASWRAPEGPGSSLEGRAQHPVVHIAYEDALAATSTPHAPWYVVPADRNWFRDLVVSEILVATLESLDIRLPEGDPGIEGLRVT